MSHFDDQTAEIAAASTAIEMRFYPAPRFDSFQLIAAAAEVATDGEFTADSVANALYDLLESHGHLATGGAGDSIPGEEFNRGAAWG